jgi:hypothetical protein
MDSRGFLTPNTDLMSAVLLISVVLLPHCSISAFAPNRGQSWPIDFSNRIDSGVSRSLSFLT